MKAPETISLFALRAVISERVRDAGTRKKFAEKVGLTASAWGNLLDDDTRKPGPRMLAILGYEEEPPRYRKVKP